ncbi:MAG: hypothetical protein KGK30_00300 [Elusimicrobia bacterium]|nr:hypothetical protein [Elusimicrobiota bacterium]
MIVLYVTGHGFGHATRAAALARALKDRQPGLPLQVRTSAPAWIFQQTCPGLPVSRGGADAGLVQRDALDVDLEASLRAQRALDRSWPALVEAEARWLRRLRASLVVADIPPLAFAAAAKAGAPAVGVSTFCWDWILEPYAMEDGRWRAAQRRCAEAYALAQAAYRLPLHGDFPSFRRVVDVPLVCRRSARGREDFDRRHGLRGKSRPLVLVAFGGFGLGPLRLSARQDLRGFLFAGYGPKPQGLRADWLRLPARDANGQLDALAACDVVVGKPGYGVVAEALAHGKRMLYLPREGFRETAALVSGLRRRGACASIAREEFFAGRWRGPLEALLSIPAPRAVAADGARWLAGELLDKVLK